MSGCTNCFPYKALMATLFLCASPLATVCLHQDPLQFHRWKDLSKWSSRNKWKEESCTWWGHHVYTHKFRRGGYIYIGMYIHICILSHLLFANLADSFWYHIAACLHQRKKIRQLQLLLKSVTRRSCKSENRMIECWWNSSLKFYTPLGVGNCWKIKAFWVAHHQASPYPSTQVAFRDEPEGRLIMFDEPMGHKHNTFIWFIHTLELAIFGATNEFQYL